MEKKNIFTQLKGFIESQTPTVLATVIAASGSAPQVPGSSALFGPDGLIAGTIGGGPAEYQVMLRAKAAHQTGLSELISFDLAGLADHHSDSICGGSMTILLDAQTQVHAEVWTQLSDDICQHKSGTLFTIAEEDEEKTVMIRRFWIKNGDISILPQEYRELAAMAIQGMDSGEHGVPCRFLQVPLSQPGIKNTWFFLQPVVPPPSLVIAGAGHVGKAVATIGKFLGFEVTIWDDRPDFANALHCPDADHHFTGPFSDFSRLLTIDSQTWLVIVTRGHHFDAVVLKEWILSRPAYLGMMGSRSKVAQMRDMFLEKGWASEEEWNRVYTPIGLKIGAKTVEEIAVSIAAELIQVSHGHS